MMRRVLFAMTIAVLALSVGCGGSSKRARNSNDSMDSLDNASAEDNSSTADVEQSDLEKSDNDDSGAKKKKAANSDNPKNNPDPEFKEGGSVNDAINAVPQGLPRENMEQEVLDKPLLDTSLYASCKLTPANHFEIKFAVWNGRIVGMDVKSTPKNAKLEDCVRGAAMKATWREKTKSLNISTVMF
jgi:hypothetical protein